MMVIPFARRARCKHKPNYKARRVVTGKRRVDGGGEKSLKSVANQHVARVVIYGGRWA